MPASLFALARGHGEAAIGAAAAVNVLSVARGLLSGRTTEVILRGRWTELVDATRRYDVAHLRAREDMHSVVALLDAVVQRATFEASTLPQLVANALGLGATLAAVLVVLGARWLVLGLVAVALASPVLFIGHRFLRRAQTQSFESFNDAALGFEVLLDGATELRVHGVEERHAAQLSTHIRAMAAAEKKATTASVLVGLLPVGIALFAGVIPLRERMHELGAATARLAEIGILGATALAIALGLLRNLESYARDIPFRRTAERFVAGAPAPRPEGTQPVDLAGDDVHLDGVAFTYPDSQIQTPSPITATWRAGVGLALAGDNGAGKTTLALCLIGLLEPTEGALRWGDVAARDIAWRGLREHVVYVPQHGYVAGNQSILWHLTLLAREPPSRAAIERALREVGLWEVLERRPVDPLDVPVAELSGGERKRMHLARAIIGCPELVVLDEPEAGLDAASRGWLRDFIAGIARDRRVLIIAHDAAVVPADFRSVRCVRSSVESAAGRG